MRVFVCVCVCACIRTCVCIHTKINMIDFETLLCVQIIRGDLDQAHPHDAQVSSRVMRTHHTHFVQNVPIGEAG